MTFEEEFPSLKGQNKDKISCNYEGAAFDIYRFNQLQIQECCLDKARVKEAIRKAAISDNDDDYRYGMINVDYLLKELGL